MRFAPFVNEEILCFVDILVRREMPRLPVAPRGFARVGNAPGSGSPANPRVIAATSESPFADSPAYFGFLSATGEFAALLLAFVGRHEKVCRNRRIAVLGFTRALSVSFRNGRILARACTGAATIKRKSKRRVISSIFCLPSCSAYVPFEVGTRPREFKRKRAAGMWLKPQARLAGSRAAGNTLCGE